MVVRLELQSAHEVLLRSFEIAPLESKVRQFVPRPGITRELLRGR